MALSRDLRGDPTEVLRPRILVAMWLVALAFLSVDSQLLFFSEEFVFTILAPLLLLMSLAFAWGFTKDLLAE